MKQNKPWKMALIDGLGLKQIMIRNYIFRPPNPPMYSFEEDSKEYKFRLKDQKLDDEIVITSHLLSEGDTYCPFICLKKYGIFQYRAQITKRNTPNISEGDSEGSSHQSPLEHRILKNRQSSPQEQKLLVLYSHGNASDLCDVYYFGARIVKEYNVDFIGYDYTGYGHGIGRQTTEKQTYIDLQAVLSYAVLTLQYPLNKIILWGFSIGSGPTTEIASRYPSIGGVILQAPLASIYYWLDSNKKSIQYDGDDIYQNIIKIQTIKSKILLIHGDSDTIIDIKHSQLLFEKYKQINVNSHNIQFISVLSYDHNNLTHIIEDADTSLGEQITIFLRSIHGNQPCDERDINLLKLTQVKEIIPDQNVTVLNHVPNNYCSNLPAPKKIDKPKLTKKYFGLCVCQD